VPVNPVLPPVPVVTLSTQELLTQFWVDVQAVLQLPQFALLLVVSTQLDPHKVCPLAQLELQLLLLQTWPVLQVVEQLPQWVASEATQEPLQLSMPDGHLHTLSWQVCPPEQGFPQTPQLFTSDEVSTQFVPQGVSPPLQVGPTTPPVPPPGVPPVAVVPPGEVPFAQAAATKARPSPKINRRALVMTSRFPRGPKAISPGTTFQGRFWGAYSIRERCTRLLPGVLASLASASHFWRRQIQSCSSCFRRQKTTIGITFLRLWDRIRRRQPVRALRERHRRLDRRSHRLGRHPRLGWSGVLYLLGLLTAAHPAPDTAIWEFRGAPYDRCIIGVSVVVRRIA